MRDQSGKWGEERGKGERGEEKQEGEREWEGKGGRGEWGVGREKGDMKNREGESKRVKRER